MFVALLLALAVARAQPGLRCSDHPQPIDNPVLLHSWTHTRNPRPVENNVYIPRYRRMLYRPVGQPESTKYLALDLFFSTAPTNGQRLVTLHTHREALVYIFAHANRASNARPELPGWETEGYAVRRMPDIEADFGVFEKRRRFMPQFALVFSRVTRNQRIDIPDMSVVKEAAGSAVIDGDFHVRIAELDGSASVPPPRFKGRIVRPGKECPPSLHNAWAVPEPDDSDEDVAGVMFNSWHPAWDPCYWCTYGHEHGSSPMKYLGYRPRYGLVARKNDRENESDSGFKDFIFEQDNYVVNINIHAQTSLLRRAGTQLHTMTVIVVDRTTKELLIELRHKGDFGFLSARQAGKNGDGFVPLREEDRLLESQQRGVRRLRALNVININDLDSRFQYRDPPSVLFGTYENWRTLGICSTGSRDKEGISIDIQSPSTALRTDNDLSTRIQLGRRPEGRRFYNNVALQRTFSVREVRIAPSLCRFENGRVRGGFFYTNAAGTRLMPGPGPTAVRQFIKRGVDVKFVGSFGQTDPWLGLYRFRDFSGNFFFNVNFGIDPSRN